MMKLQVNDKVKIKSEFDNHQYKDEIRKLAGTYVTIREVLPYDYKIKETQDLDCDGLWELSDFQIDEDNPVQHADRPIDTKNNITILINEFDDALLYLNGQVYQDIDTTWVDCINFIRDILNDTSIRIISYPKDRRDFPDNLDELNI